MFVDDDTPAPVALRNIDQSLDPFDDGRSHESEGNAADPDLAIGFSSSLTDLRRDKKDCDTFKTVKSKPR